MTVLGALADYVHWRRQEVGEPLEPTGLHPHEAEELVEAAAARAEGTELVRLSDEETETLLAAMRENAYGKEACCIGRTTAEEPGIVALRTALGGLRIVDMPLGNLVPRIC